MDQGGSLWMVIDVLAVVALGAALAYGIGMWRKRHRDPTIERIRDNAVKNLYKQPDDK